LMHLLRRVVPALLLGIFREGRPHSAKSRHCSSRPFLSDHELKDYAGPLYRDKSLRIILGMDRSLKRHSITILLVLILLSTQSSCVLRSSDTMREPEVAPAGRNVASQALAAPRSRGLIRPVIPHESAGEKDSSVPGGQPSSGSDGPAGTSTAPVAGSQQPNAVPDARESRKRREWEDQKVKQIALDLAAKTPGVKKIKVCLAFKNDEWLIVLYKDVGSAYELKQYFWSKDRPEPEAYLVFERVPKSRLAEHLSKTDPDRACETLDPPR
jgi:hypothetical protein